MTRIFWLLILMISISFTVNAQEDTSKLPYTPKDFAKHIEDKFNKLQSDQAEAILERFIEAWETSKYDQDEQRAIMEVEVIMDQKRYRPSGGYQTYLKTLNTAKTNNISGKDFKEWHKALNKLLEGDRNKFNAFNSAITNFFSKNAIYASRTKNWYVNTQDLSIKFEEKPYFKFNNVNLTCVGQKDTIDIQNTSGTMDVLEDNWNGNGGKVTWKKVGFSPNKVYANLSDYTIQLNRGYFNADSVKFHNDNFMNEPLLGSLTDKLSSLSKNRTQFPQFNSYQASYEIFGLFDNINYQGGFSMKGRQVSGTGTRDKKARIEVIRNGKTQFYAKSERFTIAPEGIDAKRTNSTIYFKEDSLYHSNIRFKYRDSTRLMTLSKGDGLGESPFNSSYHKLEINVDQIEWNIDESSLSMRMRRNSQYPAEFKSFNYFKLGHYHKIQSILSYNPLNRLKEYGERNNSRRFTDEGFTNFLGSQLDNIKRMLIRLSKEGFILYDIETGDVRLQPKLFHYVKAEKDLTDYDNIAFESVISAKANANLNLSNGNLQIEGVGKASLSDTSAVRIFPENQQITIKENLNTEFDGQMIAGRFHYYGNDFYFNYDSFKVALNNIDSLRIYFPDEETGQMKAVDHVIEDISGSVAINHPNNKSGKVQMGEYPIFNCTEDAVVHYEKSYIHNKVYKKDSFYFEIDPFEVDSLKNFTRQGIQFDGTFHSANIFPEFDHQLTLMKDNSLGFTKRTPQDGYPMYNGKGTGKMEMTLNKDGLKGSGQIDYLASSTESREFYLFPDSTNAVTMNFKISEKGQNKYPPVSGDRVYNHWVPYKDSMYIKERDPLTVYNKDFQFEGDLILTPDRLYGTGMFSYQNAEIQSKALSFQPNSISSDTASFKVKSDKEGKPAFQSPNVNFTLDLRSQILDGASNFKDTLSSLNYHRYQTSIQKFTWDVEGKSIAMKTSQDQKMNEAFMESTDPAKDSLKFNSTAAYFDLKKYTIEAKNIPHINLADAQVYPSDGEILIKESSEIKTLEDARIKADTNYFFHEFFKAKINIKAQSKYFAKGNYNYKDLNGEEHKIYFDDIRVNENGQTIANTSLPDSQDFPLSPKFSFQGDVNLKAKRKELVFRGEVKPSEISNDLLGMTSIPISDTVYPEEIYISYDKPASKKELTSGILVSKRLGELYPRFIGKKQNAEDYNIYEASGMLSYNYSKNQYEIAPKGKSSVDSGQVNKLVYKPNKQELSAKGPINFQFDNKKVDLRTAGIATYNLKDSSHSIDLVMGIDFPFHPGAIQNTADSITNLAFYKPDSRDARNAGVIGMSHVIQDPEDRQTVVNELQSFGTLISSESYQPNFLFSDLQLKWDANRRAFVNKGTIGVGTILQTEINKKLDGYLKLNTFGKQQLQFTVKGSTGNFYYFNFKKDKCKFYASDIFFMEKIQKEIGDYSDNNFTLERTRDEKEKLFFERSFQKQKKEGD